MSSAENQEATTTTEEQEDVSSSVTTATETETTTTTTTTTTATATATTTSSSPQQQKKQEPQQQEQSGGWGGWFSSKITQASDYLKPVVTTTLNEYVTTTIDDYIRPAVDSASHMVRDLQTTWDEDQAAEEKANQEAEEKENKKEGEEEEITSDERNEEENENKEGEEDEDVGRVESLLAAMGSSVSTFGTAASFMGSVIQSGITKVQTSTNMDQVKSMANQVVETTKKATNTVVEQVNERKIYEKTMEAGHKTYNTLENVSKRALDILLPGEGEEQEVTSSETTTTNTDASEKETKEEEETEEEEEEIQEESFDFNNYFATCGGANALQSLAKSSEDGATASTKKMRKIPVADRLALDETFGKIREMGEEEEITAEAEGEITLGTEFEEAQAKSKTVVTEATEKIQKIISEFKEAIANGSASDKAVQCSDSILLEGSKKIVELTAANIEQLLCASDLFLEQVKSQEPINVSEVSLEENPNFSKIVFILKLANSLHADVSQLSNSVIAFLREVATTAKASSESNEGVDKKTSANINTLYLETSSALSLVQDAKKYLSFLYYFFFLILLFILLIFFFLLLLLRVHSFFLVFFYLINPMYLLPICQTYVFSNQQ